MACTDVLLSSEQCVFLVLVVTLPYRQVPLHFVVTRQKSERLLHDGREAKREASILNLHVQTPPLPPRPNGYTFEQGMPFTQHFGLLELFLTL